MEKEKQNASNLQVLEGLQREATEIAEEQYCRLEEARLNLTAPLTSEAKTSEAEDYRGARPKTTSRAKITSFVPSTLPQDAMALAYSSYLRLRWEQAVQDHASLLRDEVFNIIPGTIKTQHDIVS